MTLLNSLKKDLQILDGFKCSILEDVQQLKNKRLKFKNYNVNLLEADNMNLIVLEFKNDTSKFIEYLTLSEFKYYLDKLEEV